VGISVRIRVSVSAAAALALLLAPGLPQAAAKTKPAPTSRTTTTATTEPVPTVPLTSSLSRRVLPIDRAGSALDLPYCGNGPVGTANAAVRTVVVVVHGTNRNACDYASYVAEAAGLAGELASTLVVAPHFSIDSDLSATDTRTLYWSSGGWKSGAGSLSAPWPRPWSVSSYEALDALAAAAADRTRFPGLTRIVIAGHSAGGQFVNRYAASTRLTADQTPGLDRRFVVANPSTYLYFDGRRSDGTALRQLTAAEVAACPGYDRYKYGLGRRHAFLAALDEATLRQRYAGSDVRYLLGERDTSTTSTTLDTGCEAQWQGAHRLQRGLRYHDLLDDVLGADVHERHRLAVVPGVGHDGRGMLTSAAGRSALFR
jgi:pimeloyl-ACP methyl ester carboxylesterase